MSMLTIMVFEKIHKPHSISELLCDNQYRELRKSVAGCLIEDVIFVSISLVLVSYISLIYLSEVCRTTSVITPLANARHNISFTRI